MIWVIQSLEIIKVLIHKYKVTQISLFQIGIHPDLHLMQMVSNEKMFFNSDLNDQLILLGIDVICLMKNPIRFQKSIKIPITNPEVAILTCQLDR